MSVSSTVLEITLSSIAIMESTILLSMLKDLRASALDVASLEIYTSEAITDVNVSGDRFAFPSSVKARL